MSSSDTKTSSDVKTVLIGVSGGVAAYKSCEVLRGLQKAGVRVKVVMSEHATHFVDPLTFRALTNEPVAIGLFDDPQDPIHHISLAQEADVFLLAPCTANVMVAPAMNVHMYENPATQENIATLKRRGFTFIESEEGYLACGEVGKGRMADPEVIVAAVLKKLEGISNPLANNLTTMVTDTPTQKIPAIQPLFDDPFEDKTMAFPAVSAQLSDTSQPEKDLSGKRIMITAGPTVEPIDPVRYLTNRSSGKFGYAIAEAAAQRGAQVTLISGPVALAAPQNVKVTYIETALELLEACEKVFPQVDAALFSAAVADVRPANPSEKKLKKGLNDKELESIELTENPDVLATLGNAKTSQIVVGFAAETNDVIEYAKKKLIKKNADMIVANEVGAKKTFGEDDNEIWLVTPKGVEHHDRATKLDLAHIILDRVKEMWC